MGTVEILGLLGGLALFLYGMQMMSDGLEDAAGNRMKRILEKLTSNRFLGVAVGAGITAIIQSSSASVGILQALAMAGLIGFDSAVFVLFGQNIGTCITAVLASIGTNRAAKRTTVIHLLFNLIGTTVFTTACLLLPVTDWVSSITPGDMSKQIANMHTIFNITTTLLLLPFGTYLANLAAKILPEREEANHFSLSDEFRRGSINLGAIAVHTDLLKQEIGKMVEISRANVNRAYNAVLESNTKALKQITEQEETLDKLNKEISQYISKILVHNNNKQNVAEIEQYFLITGNAERIGDHALNIAGYTEVIKNKSIEFSKGAKEEIAKMQQITELSLKTALDNNKERMDWLLEVEELEEQMDEMTNLYRERHLERMRKGECSKEACILYSELLTDFERIGDHILNIAQAFAKIKSA